MLKIFLMGHDSRHADLGVGALPRAAELTKPRLVETFAQCGDLRNEIAQALALGRDKIHSCEDALAVLMPLLTAEEKRS